MSALARIALAIVAAPILTAIIGASVAPRYAGSSISPTPLNAPALISHYHNPQNAGAVMAMDTLIGTPNYGRYGFVPSWDAPEHTAPYTPLGHVC